MLKRNGPVVLMSVILMGMLLSVAPIAFGAAKTHTIKGKVITPSGEPITGALMTIYPVTPNMGWDAPNAFYKIPSYDYHRVTTDQNGEFTMTNVIDYPENYTHYYVVVSQQYQKYYIRQLVGLKNAYPVVNLTIAAEDVSQLIVTLKDRDGKPFNGKRVLFIQTGRVLGDPRYGVSFLHPAEFKDGVTQYRIFLKPGGYGRVAVLQFEDKDQAHKTILAKGMKTGDSLDALNWVVKDRQGRPLDVETSFLPQGEVRLGFQLP